jgi:hypothetical protein
VDTVTNLRIPSKAENYSSSLANVRCSNGLRFIQLDPTPLRAVNVVVFPSVLTNKILYIFYISPTPQTGTGHRKFLAIKTLISLEHGHDFQHLKSCVLSCSKFWKVILNSICLYGCGLHKTLNKFKIFIRISY